VLILLLCVLPATCVVRVINRRCWRFNRYAWLEWDYGRL